MSNKYNDYCFWSTLENTRYLSNFYQPQIMFLQDIFCLNWFQTQFPGVYPTHYFIQRRVR